MTEAIKSKPEEEQPAAGTSGESGGNGKLPKEEKIENKTEAPENSDFKVAEIWIRNGQLMVDGSAEFWSDKVRALGVLEYCKDVVKNYTPPKPKKSSIIQPKGGIMNFVRGGFKGRK